MWNVWQKFIKVSYGEIYWINLIIFIISISQLEIAFIYEKTGNQNFFIQNSRITQKNLLDWFKLRTILESWDEANMDNSIVKLFPSELPHTIQRRFFFRLNRMNASSLFNSNLWWISFWGKRNFHFSFIHNSFHLKLFCVLLYNFQMVLITREFLHPSSNLPDIDWVENSVELLVSLVVLSNLPSKYRQDCI